VVPSNGETGRPERTALTRLQHAKGLVVPSRLSDALQVSLELLAALTQVV
jgi:hypothetical protein